MKKVSYAFLLVEVILICFFHFSDMAPFYEETCKELNWKIDSKLLKTMQETNTKELQRLDEAVDDAEKNLGETEVRDAMLKKAEYLCRIGDKVYIYIYIYRSFALYFSKKIFFSFSEAFLEVAS